MEKKKRNFAKFSETQKDIRKLKDLRERVEQIGYGKVARASDTSPQTIIRYLKPNPIFSKTEERLLVAIERLSLKS